jgi:hypothetical protein
MLRHPFETASKRRRRFPSSESRVKTGDRVAGIDTEFVEKLGRYDPCPCGSGRRFPPVLPQHRQIRSLAPRPTATSGTATSSSSQTRALKSEDPQAFFRPLAHQARNRIR